MSKQEIEVKYFSQKGKYSSAKSEIARIESKKQPANSNNKSLKAIAAFDNLFKKF